LEKGKNIPLFKLNYGRQEVDAVSNVLESKWISLGPKTVELEDRFAEMLGAQYAVALSNCTAALHLAMITLGVGPGDEVILPSLTFVATANVVRYVGATPVFADIVSTGDWTISADDVEAKVSDRTKAIIAMHYAGFSADMERLKAGSEARGLSLVEDACHAPGSTWKGRRVGTVGDVSCYSFYANKNISTGEGGMLVTGHEHIAERAKLLRSHGMTTTAVDRRESSQLYDVVELGYNYRLDDMRASLGLVQLEKLTKDLEERRAIAGSYKKHLASVENVEIPFSQYEGLPSYYIFPIRITRGDRQTVMDKMLARGIHTSWHYPPVHNFRVYERFKTPLPMTELVASQCLSLPMYSGLSEEQVEVICRNLAEVVEEL